MWNLTLQSLFPPKIANSYAGGKLFRGIFEWGFLYKEIEVPERERRRHAHFSEPYASPTHAGGLFAIDREFFLKLGGYDPGLLIWGGENYELSFKVEESGKNRIGCWKN